MLHGVPTLSPDMADIVVHRGVDEHELRMGSEPGARFRDWAGAGAAIARVERYQVRCFARRGEPPLAAIGREKGSLRLFTSVPARFGGGDYVGGSHSAAAHRRPAAMLRGGAGTDAGGKRRVRWRGHV